MQPKTSTTKNTTAAEELAALQKQHAELTATIAAKEKELKSLINIFKAVASANANAARRAELEVLRETLKELEARLPEYQLAAKAEQATARDARLVELRAMEEAQAEVIRQVAHQVDALLTVELDKQRAIERELANQGPYNDPSVYIAPAVCKFHAEVEGWDAYRASIKTPAQRLKERDEEMEREMERRVKRWQKADNHNDRAAAEGAMVVWGLKMEEVMGKRPGLPLGVSWPKPPTQEQEEAQHEHFLSVVNA